MEEILKTGAWENMPRRLRMAEKKNTPRNTWK